MDEDKALYEEMQRIKTILLKKEIPDKYPENMSRIKLQSFKNTFHIDRFDFINLSSFALVSKRWVRPLAEYIGLKKCLEIMAGKGVLSKCLRDYGVDIIATDNYTWKWHRNSQNKNGKKLDHEELWFDVRDLDCVESIIKFGDKADYIICCWPPFRTSALYESLIKMREVNPECRLIYIGEGKKGCNAESRFFDEALYIKDDRGFNNAANLFQRWPQMDDKINLIK